MRRMFELRQIAERALPALRIRGGAGPMKRSGPPKRKAPLKRSKALSARSSKRGKGKAREGRSTEPKPRLSYASAAVAHSREPAHTCCCGCGRRATEWHHVFEQQHYPELADEPDNVVKVNPLCHARHTNRFRRLPRRAIRRAERLATTEKMKSYLDHKYGPVEETA